MGNLVVYSDRRPDYWREIEVVDLALDAEVPSWVGFDPFAKLRYARDEMNTLIPEIDDWIRVGDHVHVKTMVREVMPVEGLIRTEHYAEWDEIPADWTRRAARILADLRSQLDLLISDLCARAADRPLTESEERRISFPIDHVEHPITARDLRKQLAWLNDESRQAILDAQPMHDHPTVDFHRNVLWLLNRLNNLDKHRALNVVGGGQVLSRGPSSQVFSEGELLLPALDIMGMPCEDSCVFDATVLLAARGAEMLEHPDGRFEPVIGLCRFLRSAYALVGLQTLELLETENVMVLRDGPPPETTGGVGSED